MSKKVLKTDRQVAGLGLEGAPYEASIAGVRRLNLRVLKSGEKAFELRYVTAAGTRRRMPLGAYPGLSLADATRRALELRVAVVAGADPAGDRLSARLQARTGETLDELAEGYFAAAEKGLHGGRGRPKSTTGLKSERSRYACHIGPALGRRKFAELARSDIKQFMRGLAVKGDLSADSINSVGRTLSAMLAFAVHEDRIESNPTARLTRPLALKPRDRMFPIASLRKLWRALEEPLPEGLGRPPRKVRAEAPIYAPAEPAVSLALRLALVTLTRRADVAAAQWDEFDLRSRTWTIPAARHKSRRVHVVPLTATALDILAKARQLRRPAPPAGQQDLDIWVFPSGRVAGTHVAETALTRAVTRTCDVLKIAHGSPHDFRRTGATLLTSEEGGVRRFMVAKLLGHAAVEGAVVTEVYDRNEYLPEKRRALETWERILLAIVRGSEDVSTGRSQAA